MLDHRCTVVQRSSLLHNFSQLTLNSDSPQVQILLAACRRFAMVMIPDNWSQLEIRRNTFPWSNMLKKQFIIIIPTVALLFSFLITKNTSPYSVVWYTFRSNEIRTLTSSKFKNQTHDKFKILGPQSQLLMVYQTKTCCSPSLRF